MPQARPVGRVGAEKEDEMIQYEGDVCHYCKFPGPTHEKQDGCVAALWAEVERLREASEWQPFEKAPKNDSFFVWMPQAIHGSNIQVMRRHPNVTIVAGHFLFDFPDNQPTHWRPLLDGPRPDPPKATT